jgi:3-deoxy-manno-octulosonate cytidylyltransferase (CMP-KDO synthetase)
LKALGIIPARYASTRFPGKPLAMIGRQSMIERVYRQAVQSGSLQEVRVATDDKRIHDHVRSFGGHAMMTSADHRSGTDRCAEALTAGEGQWDVVLNIQGDEPFITPGQIGLVVSAFKDEKVEIASLARKAEAGEADDPHKVKVVMNERSEAMYFSRAPIPHSADPAHAAEGRFIHVGLYGFRTEVLKSLPGLPETRLESLEKLEQLRWLGHGYRIHMTITHEHSHNVDTPADLDRLKSTFRL